MAAVLRPDWYASSTKPRRRPNRPASTPHQPTPRVTRGARPLALPGIFAQGYRPGVRFPHGTAGDGDDRQGYRGLGRRKRGRASALIRRTLPHLRFRRSESRMSVEQVELLRVVVRMGRDGLVVTAYLSEVGRFELQSELHQRVCNVRGSFIGDSVFGRFGWALARHRGRSRPTLQFRPSCGSSCLR